FWLLVWMGAFIALRPSLLAAPGWTVASALLTLCLAIAASKAGTAIASVAVTRRIATTLRWIGLLLVLAILPIVVFVFTEALRVPDSRMVIDAAEMLGWTP